jgi:hypothetical protein
VGVDLIGLGLAAVNGLHVQGVAQHEGDALIVTEVGEPVPSKQALAGDGEVVAERGDDAEEGVGAGGDGLLQDDGAGRVEDAQGQGSGVQIDPARESLLLVIESHHGLRVRDYLSLVTSSMPNANRP